MTKTLILGASGQIARHVVQDIAGGGGIGMTLFMRDAGKLSSTPANASVVQGDVLDRSALDAAMEGQDVVYANLTGDDLDDQARSIIASMQAADVRRLIFVLSLGIYDEVPGKFGEWNRQTIGEELKPFRRAGDAIEASGLDYTIIRPAWLTDDDEADYELTLRDEPFKGTVVSRKSVADLITKIIRSPGLHLHGNVGVNKPGTDGDRPSFM
ncbi:MULTISPECIES: SDR family oxidoreductase [unclassified Agrobacterium]|uniref:SDR family oxidoreductase n=1 Tax=unclassified Agrobacterium TaxID=2632611 RepID=UPI002448E52E|nr:MULTISPECIES: SDR family oxidoreductase [unclassified Agrobacterium]MDH0615749.1 SDR family oxidoreductase [Agrobacterium sp. GD03872]MDH0697897.1 SDR family oxidoreductase [Agrobacterium sp. GD03871]MDH1061682.1 SDR family oxidoreductase [Agrobacterium sp. GD03992]MDH2221713.1 SDR family oxidoreductase [Agrobacterium sp. GD03638]MDH2226396.1 SDR family oxidoreductase [Agrobacterium sp. GD03642]